MVVMKEISLARGVVVETVAEEALAIIPGSNDLVRLSGPAAKVVRDVMAGEVVTSDATVTELIRRGVLTGSSAMTRRGMLKAGAVGAGAGIAVLTMPSVAAASSGDGSGGSGGTTGPTIELQGFTAGELLNSSNRSRNSSLMSALGITQDVFITGVFVTNPPYAENPIPTPAPSGTASFGGVDYAPILFDFISDNTDSNGDNIILTAWWMEGRIVSNPGDAIVLTFDFEGRSYRVTAPLVLG